MEDLYKFKQNVSSIWNNHKKHFKGTYKVVETFTKEEPIYRDDYIEPYDYKYIDFVVIEDIDTKKQETISKSYLNKLFEITERSDNENGKK